MTLMISCTSTDNPFDAPDADLVLRSEDGFYFKLFRRILIEGSPFFKHMFSLPQPCLDDETDGGTIPIIDVSEDSHTLRIVLGLTYPCEDPETNSLDEVSAALECAVKYELPRATSILRHRLVSPQYLDDSPTRVYAIACRYEFEEEARIASARTLSLNILDCPLSDDLKHITAYSYHRLLDLHRRRSQAAQKLIQLEENVRCTQCSAGHYGAVVTPKWFLDWERRAKDELQVRPTTDKIFSMEFLSESALAGCHRCAGSILESYPFFAKLKTEIDNLPSTI